MNFDLNTEEQSLVQQTGLLMQEFRDAENILETGEPQQTREIMLAIACRLSGIGYTASVSSGMMAAMCELAACAPSVFLALEMSQRVFGNLIRKYATEKQKKELSGLLKTGQIIGTVALCEENMNTEGNPLKTEGTVQGGHILISGRKTYVFNAPMADRIAVVGNVGGRTAVFLTDALSRRIGIGNRMPTMGYRGIHIHELNLDNCELPADRMMGPFEDAQILEDLRLWENHVLIAAAVGLMTRSFEAAKSFAKTHQSSGKPIIAFQEISFSLSEMLTLLQTSRLMACKAAWSAESGDRESLTVTHCAKVFCTEAAEKVAGSAMRILSGKGFVCGNAAEEAYRNAKYGQIAGTSTEIARMKIGDAVMKPGR